MFKYNFINSFAEGNFNKILIELWLMWFNGLKAGLQTKASPVWFPVRAHAWVERPGPQ